MHLKNNYAKEVFNGDIGVVFSVSPSQERITVGFEGREIPYDISEIDDLALAYAVSIHKSQGSEYPAVIIPMVTQHYPLLQRNLLYTAITRGRRLVVIVGTKKAVAIALNNDKPRRRMSSLCSRLGGVP
jgi:exodeoxyribonuclease V alpha subunit